MNNNERIVSWILNRAKEKYADDIAMILLYGSYVNGTANAKSDVDCYFIPKTPRAYEFCADFILDGIGYDIFPMSWERVENIANLKEVLLPCLGDVRILYAGTDEDRERFSVLQEKLKQNLADPVYTAAIAKEKFEQACELYTGMKGCDDISRQRTLAGYLIMDLADAVAVSNGNYFHFGLKKQYEDLQKFEKIPANFMEEYLQVVKSKNSAELLNHCRLLYASVGEYFGWELDEAAACEETVPVKKNAEAKEAPDFSGLAALYEEISSTFNKIYVCAENDNKVLAFLSAANLQGELAEAAGYDGIPYFDLLSAYDYDDLSVLAEAAKKAEDEFVRVIEAGGGVIKRYMSFEQFEQAFEMRG